MDDYSEWNFRIFESLKRSGDPVMMKGFCKYFKNFEHRKIFVEAVRILKKDKSK